MSTFSGAIQFGIRMLLIIQNVTQMKILYDEAAKIFMANCHVKVFFSPDDRDTLEMLSKELGDTTIRKQSKSHKSGGGILFDSPTISVSEEMRPLMYPHEIKMLPNDKILILRRNQTATKATRITYYKDKDFKKLSLAPFEIPVMKMM